MPDQGKVVEVNPLSDPRWDAFVASQRDGLIYHHPTWLQALGLEQDQEPIGLAYEDERHELRGVLPLFPTRGLPLLKHTARIGQRISSLPRTPLAGPLADDAGVTSALIDAAIERVRAQPDSRLEIRTDSPNLGLVSENLTTVAWRPTYVLYLPSNPDQLRFGNRSNHSRVKWAANYAAKAGVKVRQAESLADLRGWYQLYLETMRWHCLPPRPFRFFQTLWDIMSPGDLMRLLLAERYEGGRPRILAGSIFLRFGRTIYYAFNGRRYQDLALHPNDLIQWHAIHDAVQSHFQRYDFGEVPTGNGGLDRFKRKWGASTAQLYRYYYPPPSEIVDGSFKSEGSLYKIANRFWQAVPLAMTVVVGRVVYEYL